jgi:NAD(P)-dependent dehydrogenase (short-subunit alcohol dehydrogenase family)
MGVVFVAGCSSGFGEAFALAFAERGEKVLATLRDVSTAPARLRAHPNVTLHPLDVIDPAARQAALSAAVALGSLDVLVNNAGFVFSAPIEESPDAQTRRLFETDFFAPLALMQAASQLMRAQGRGGRIVNITAIGAVFSTPLMGIYCAAKHALDAASAALDVEGRAFGVRAPSVLPDPFATAIGAKAPPPILGPAYAALGEAMAQSRAKSLNYRASDLTPVTSAVLSAAYDPDPKPRYLVGEGPTTELKASITELERLHNFDLARAGLA